MKCRVCKGWRCPGLPWWQPGAWPDSGPPMTPDASTAVANVGWAIQAGGTTSGSAARGGPSLRGIDEGAAAGGDRRDRPPTGKPNIKAPKIIKWVGTVDMTEGVMYASNSDQGAGDQIKLQPNTTTIVCVGSKADPVYAPVQHPCRTEFWSLPAGYPFTKLPRRSGQGPRTGQRRHRKL